MSGAAPHVVTWRGARRLRGIAIGVLSVAAAFTPLAEPGARSAPLIAALEALVIVGFAIAGHLLRMDHTQAGTGRLLTATALLQALVHLHAVHHVVLPMLAWLAGPLSGIPAAIAMLRYPDLRLDRWGRRWAVGTTAWVLVSRLTFDVPASDLRTGWWPAATASARSTAEGATVGNAGLIACSVTFVILLARRLVQVRGVARRELAPLVVAAAGATVAAGLHAASVVNGHGTVRLGILGLEQLALALVPASFVFSAIAMRLARAVVGDVLLHMPVPADAATLQRVLAQTLDDPEVRLLRREASGSWVDEQGRPSPGPGQRQDRSTIWIHSAATVVALVLDARLARHRRLVDAIAAAVKLAMDSAHFEAAAQAHLLQVRESRRRLADAALAERRRIERDLHDGAQQRLFAASMSLGRVLDCAPDPRTRQLAEHARGEMQSAIRELRDLAHGIHPANLTRYGLARAVSSAAERLPLPVDVEIPPRRWPTAIEATAYFLICEALNNVVKHACAQSATVAVRDAPGVISLEIRDDGRGGADDRAGVGLIGLADRVHAFGGEFDVVSVDRRGTCITARLPYASV